MSSVFHPYDAALRGSRIPNPSDPPGQDQNQDQDQTGEEENNKKEKSIREEVEMNLKVVRRELNGVEGTVGMMESLCRCMLSENLEHRGENRGNEVDEEDEKNRMDKLWRREDGRDEEKRKTKE
ncbi:uncharacterized protein EAE97_004700 [Botrytis byssoidea]|uniref:Uncharacterized protein n=1 Tax=Botrytis byssoidea TaxID=139641 RepID=A0A9P5IPR8_9HELO|nr:uncharacterized protein EAE97_004700 [Botrytis byssoidea]KAF7945662.1 hypothetical protein EAE97_004700 [Botrytis byssoidea]